MRSPQIPLDPTNPYSKAHPFPMWVRYRFIPENKSDAAIKTAQGAWIDSLEWKIEPNNTKIVAEGRGFLYELIVPILDSQNRLLVNYYAHRSSGIPSREDLPLNNNDYWAFVE